MRSMVIFIVLIGFFLVGAVYVFDLRRKAEQAAQELMPVVADVIGVDIDEQNRSGGMSFINKVSYKLFVSYRYKIEGQEYSGRGVFTSCKDEIEALERKKEIIDGRNLTVYYRPSKPAFSSLNRNAAVDLNKLFTALVCLPVIGLVLFFIFFL